LELQFAAALEKWPDVISFAKNYLAVHFLLDYVDSRGDISNYYPDFFVKTGEKEIYIVETKGLEEIDVPLKMERLRKWCADINQAQDKLHFDFVFVDEEDFEKYKPSCFGDLIKAFRKYKI
jgi:type III restriction enzyme